MAVPREFATDDGPPLALVTGAARRIGRALATHLGHAGFRVAIHCNRARAEAEELAAALPGAPLVVEADLADPGAAAALVGRLPAAPAVLINNASLFEEDGLADFALDRWRRQLDVNLLAPTLLIRAMAARLPAGARGLVVNLLDAKLAAPNPDFFSYTVSKMGLAGVTELAARALAPAIRVNAIAPAVTLVSGPQSRENFAAVHALNPLQRGVVVEDIVAALAYLVATPTVTGQTLVIDGGQRFLALARDVAYMAPP